MLGLSNIRGGERGGGMSCNIRGKQLVKNQGGGVVFSIVEVVVQVPFRTATSVGHCRSKGFFQRSSGTFYTGLPLRNLD